MFYVRTGRRACRGVREPRAWPAEARGGAAGINVKMPMAPAARVTSPVVTDEGGGGQAAPRELTSGFRVVQDREQ
jgi:hypothetical protein